MRKALALVAGVLGVALVAGMPGRAEAKDHLIKTTQDHVLKACGDKLKSGGGVTGCTKCDHDLCRDYNCNSSGVGPKGCTIHVLGRKAPGSGKGRANVGPRHPNGTIVHGDGRRVPKGSPHPATVHVGGGTFHGKQVEGANSVGPAKEDTKPPFDFHGGGRPHNNPRH
jgi:hypothetical protein